MDGSKRRKLGSRVNEKTGSGIGIDTRFITFFFLNGRSTNVSIFIENLPQKKKKKKIHSQWFLISKIYQWVYGYAKRENTHTIFKYVQVVCELKLANSLYTQRLFFVLVILTQRWAQCNSRSSDVSTGRVVQSTWSYTVPLLYVFNDAPLEYVSMQTVWCCYKNVSFNVHFVLAVYTVRLQTLLF